ncbi:STAS domain-containing protein [candidate division CSSED10-310 bacterium]|uniref:STAS domain-containing protein n=1 Tax=candidate division CSSED10-310 bacterium TaxID=2855610 RepID=A0ABV6YVJ4_UNCC1
MTDNVSGANDIIQVKKDNILAFIEALEAIQEGELLVKKEINFNNPLMQKLEGQVDQLVSSLESRTEELKHQSKTLSQGMAELSHVLSELRTGNFEIRINDETLNSDDKVMSQLGELMNKTIEDITSQHVRVEEYHESTMELAMGLSECFQVLAEVRQGNLDSRVGVETLEARDELLASLGKAVNDTISELQAHVERQRYAIEELSTPILQLWDNVLALPIIGTVDTRRSLEIMEKLLAKIVEKQSKYIIIDITGVHVVDTKTADQFIKIIKAAELLGSTCIVTGIRPAVAQTMVEIGIDLAGIATVSNLREGLVECFRQMGIKKE